MSIGATLGAARRRAGMSVHDVSQRTRVTEPIIVGIEQDDYGACGGDFYARGHIRAIAHAVGEDPVPLIDEFDSTWRSEKDHTAAEAFEPGIPLRNRERRRVRGAALLGALVLAVLGFACYKFVAGADSSHPAAVAATHRAVRPAAPASVRPAGTPAVRSSAAVPSATPTPTVARPVVTLAVASVKAFGPDGTADGDHPELAAMATAGHPGRPWMTHWYGSARFAGSKDGTGLLIDLGHTGTITSVKLSLGTGSGASLQLRAGTKAELSALAKVAGATDAGGHIQLRLGSPVHARYLLVWFTQLPRDSAGTYQASVYQITVRGQR